MHKLGLAMSHKSVLMKIDSMCKGHDKCVLEWKKETEDCGKKQHMANIVQKAIHSLEQQTGSVDFAYLKSVVEVMCGKVFDNNLFEELLQNTSKYAQSLHVTYSVAISKLIDDMSPISLYQIIGDNVDIFVKAKHIGSQHQNKSIHWFNLNVVRERVNGSHLCNSQPLRPIKDVSNTEFLPSADDSDKLLDEFVVLCERVLVGNMPAFRPFKKFLVKHIPHEYSEMMKTKSEEVF